MKLEILKKGGRKALKEYNNRRRIPLPSVSTATRVIESRKYRKEKYPTAVFMA